MGLKANGTPLVGKGDEWYTIFSLGIAFCILNFVTTLCTKTRISSRAYSLSRGTFAALPQRVRTYMAQARFLRILMDQNFLAPESIWDSCVLSILSKMSARSLF